MTPALAELIKYLARQEADRYRKQQEREAHESSNIRPVQH